MLVVRLIEALLLCSVVLLLLWSPLATLLELVVVLEALVALMPRPPVVPAVPVLLLPLALLRVLQHS